MASSIEYQKRVELTPVRDVGWHDHRYRALCFSKRPQKEAH